MSTREELKARTKAVRSVADRTGSVTRFECALQHYLSAEIFETYLETAPESWEGRQHRSAPRHRYPGPVRRLG